MGESGRQAARRRRERELRECAERIDAEADLRRQDAARQAQRQVCDRRRLDERAEAAVLMKDFDFLYRHVRAHARRLTIDRDCVCGDLFLRLLGKADARAILAEAFPDVWIDDGGED